MMRQLYYCGNNLNQIARKAHALNVIDVQKYDEVSQLFYSIVQQLNNVLVTPQKWYVPSLLDTIIELNN